LRERLDALLQGVVGFHQTKRLQATHWNPRNPLFVDPLACGWATTSRGNKAVEPSTGFVN